MSVNVPLFKEADPSGFTSIPGIGGDRGGLANFLVPNGTGAVSVVNDYRWTLTDKKGRNETPHIQLHEYRLLQSSLLNSARYYAAGLSQLAATPSNPYLSKRFMNGYAGLFDFENETGFHYTFPYFSEVSNEVTSNWTALDILEKIQKGVNIISSTAGRALELGTEVAMLGFEANYPRVGIMDRPKLWESSGFRNINIKFPLYNTVDVKDIEANWDLCYLLMYQNMFNKRNFITAIPPVFYTAYIPGQFFSIAMYVSDLKIYNRGNIRMYKVRDKWRNVPDVYEIDMTLTDMIMPSQNMLACLLQENPINVQQLNQGLAESAADAIEGFARGTADLVRPLPLVGDAFAAGAQTTGEQFANFIRPSQ
jgi:hypothetical protein